MSRGYSFKLILFVLVFHFAFAPPASSQGDATQARKFDEFGDVQLSDLKARLDNFAIELQNTPAARGFVMVYRSRRDLPGLSSRLASLMKNYLVYTRGFPAERIITVDGGESSAGLVQELWIVPEGATPKPRDDAYAQYLTDTESARKFDSYYYSVPGDVADEGGDSEYLYYGDSLEAYAADLRRESRATAYVIVYAQYYIESWEEGEEGRTKTRRRVHLDRRGTAARMSRTVRAELISKYHLASSRIKVVDGGYRKQRAIELWIVPRGEHAPIATPNAFPPKRKKH